MPTVLTEATLQTGLIRPLPERGGQVIPKAERDADAAILAAATPDWRPGAAEKRNLYCRATHPERLSDERVLMQANAHFPYEADVIAAAHCRNRLPVYIEAAAEMERRIESVNTERIRLSRKLAATAVGDSDAAHADGFYEGLLWALRKMRDGQ